MAKEAASRKTKKNPWKLEPDGLKLKPIKWEMMLHVEKQKKNQSKPEPDRLKPKAIKWEKKLQVEKQKKSIKARTRRL